MAGEGWGWRAGMGGEETGAGSEGQRAGKVGRKERDGGWMEVEVCGLERWAWLVAGGWLEGGGAWYQTTPHR